MFEQQYRHLYDITDNGCWQMRQRGKYATVTVYNVTVMAHRLSLCYSLGYDLDEIEGLHVHHTCRNTLCVNPEHLELLTPAEHINAEPNSLKNRTHCSAGHEYNDINTSITKEGYRRCRVCHRERERERRRARS